MKKTYPTKAGIIIEKGKIIPWILLFEVLSNAIDPKTLSLVKKQLDKHITFRESELFTNLTELAQLIGVKDGNALHKRLLLKVDAINKKAEEEFGSFNMKERENG